LVKHALRGPPANGKSWDPDHVTETTASDTTLTASSSLKEVFPDTEYSAPSCAYLGSTETTLC
ncbi:hypothetical protein P7K49_039602, partial [Saguinus oedipus]